MFRNGSLTRLDGSSYSSNPNDSANALQAAIWYFEGEGPMPAEGTLAYEWVSGALVDGWIDVGNVQVLNLLNASGGPQNCPVLVPEPSTLLLLGAGLIGLGLLGRKKFRTKP
jgi:hypothetical protein